MKWIKIELKINVILNTLRHANFKHKLCLFCLNECCNCSMSNLSLTTNSKCLCYFFASQVTLMLYTFFIFIASRMKSVSLLSFLICWEPPFNRQLQIDNFTDLKCAFLFSLSNNQENKMHLSNKLCVIEKN